MSDHRTTVNTELNREGIFRRVSAAVPELSWRRAESEYGGELIVSGWNDLGAHVKFYLSEDRIDAADVFIWLEGADPDQSGSTAWREQLRAKLIDQVLPELERATPGPDERGDTWPYPMTTPGVVHPVEHRPESTEPPPPPVRGLDRPSTGRPDHLPSRVGQRYGTAEAVIDLYQWLPGWGEDHVGFRAADQGVALDVRYDLDGDGEATAIISVMFEGARHFCYRRFPGPSGLTGEPNISGDDGLCLVVDQGDSPLLQEIAAGAPAGHRSRLHHYSVRFWEMGMAYDVIAERVHIE